MNYQVRVYEVGRNAKPEDGPVAVDTFVVSAETNMEARQAVRSRLEQQGQAVRSISFLWSGEIAATVFEPAPRMQAAAGAR